MKPAFHDTLTLSEDEKMVNVGGPYDLEGGEEDAYFWFRISQPHPRVLEEAKKRGEKLEVVEAIGIHDREKDEMATELTEYRDAVRADVATAIDGALPAAGQRVSHEDVEAAAAKALQAAVTAIAEKGPSWLVENVKTSESKKFRTGEAYAEGWLLLKSEGDPRGSNEFWTSEVTLVTADANPAAS